MNILSLIVQNISDEGMRLDTYIASQETGLSRSRLKNSLISVTVNGKNAKSSKKVRLNDRIDIEWEDPVQKEVLPENIELSIVYEDAQVTVVNKKQGMVTHPAAGNWKGTLVNALLYHWGVDISQMPQNTQTQRPGIVHRLDKDTSGLLITARNIDSELWLQTQFRQRRVKKTYAAILCGIPPASHGSIKTQILRDPHNRKKFIANENTSRGKFAHTVYRCVAVYGKYTLVLFTLKTGRTHQLRVHAKHIACPILGDPIYGKKDVLFDSATLMLHAKELGIRLPGAESFSLFTVPIPLRFKKVMKKLKTDYERRLIHDI